MLLPYYQINAFTRDTFGGNPAGVCPLDHWLPAATLLAIAAENNFAETAYFVRRNAAAAGHNAPATINNYDLRWFTPAAEVDLCGHATVASAHVLFSELSLNRTIKTNIA